MKLFFFKLETAEGMHSIRLQGSALGDSFFVLARNLSNALKQIRQKAHKANLYYHEIALIKVNGLFESKLLQTGGILNLRPEFDASWRKLNVSGKLDELIGISKKQQALDLKADRRKVKKLFGTEGFK